MPELEVATTVDIASRIRRSDGRTGRTFSANAKLTENELGELAAVARSEGKSVSEWARETLLREVRKPKENALFTELVATRLLLLNLLKPLALGKTITEPEFASISTQVQANKRKVSRELEQQYTSTVSREA